MRTSLVLSIIFAFVISISTTRAEDNKLKEAIEKSSVVTYDQVEKTLMEGLLSDNLGLKTSSAYMLGELGSTKAVIPLMRMLRSEEDENVRLMAACALMKIDSEKGRYMIHRVSQLDDSERVKRMCGIFYTDYIMKKYGHFKESYDSLVAGF